MNVVNIKIRHFYFAENRTFLNCLDIFYGPCRRKMIMSYFSKIEMSSFAMIKSKGGRNGKGYYQNEQKGVK